MNELLEQERQRNDDLLMKLQEKEKYITRFEGISSTLQDKENNFRLLQEELDKIRDITKRELDIMERRTKEELSQAERKINRAENEAMELSRALDVKNKITYIFFSNRFFSK